MCQQDRRPRGRDELRTNWQIRVPNVRLFKDEQPLGIVSTDEARRLATEAGLDLVEVVATARPPVCKIMDYGRFKYEQKLKQKEQIKRQRESQIHLKEIRLRPGTGEHDLETKVNQAKKFIEDGMKVQFNLEFKGSRELFNRDQGFTVVNRVLALLNEVVSVERMPKMEGKKIICVVAPK